MVSGIIEILRLSTAVQTAVGQNIAGSKFKIYPALCPQTERPPYMIIALTGTNPAMSKGEVSDLDNESFDIFIFTDSYEQGHSIDIAIRTALDNASGTTDETNITFNKIWFVSRRDAQVQGREGIFTRVVSYSCHINRGDVS